MSVEVMGIFHTTNQLTLAATFGTNIIYGPVVMVTNVWSMDFGHLMATDGERVVLMFWDDSSSNGVHEADETSVSFTLPVTNHANTCSYKLSYGMFDADHNNIPDWWEVLTGLAEYDGPHGEFDDTDGDGLVNLHEYWAGCNPLIPDGSNTLLSVMARSIDDRIVEKNPTNSIYKFINYEVNGTNGIFQIDTNCWVFGIDTSCVSMWNDRDKQFRAGTVISPRHVLQATHYCSGVGTVLYFCGTDGSIHTNVVEATRRVDGTDIQIALLQTELNTSVIHPARILPVDFRNYIGTGKGLPVLRFDQNEGYNVCEVFSDMPTSIFYSFGTSESSVATSEPMSDFRQAFYNHLIDKDSGNPLFLVVGSQVVLLGAIHGGSNQVVPKVYARCFSPFVTCYADVIQTAMDLLAPGYVLLGLECEQYDGVEQEMR